MSKICVNCGVELEQIAVFCDECGTRQPSIQEEQQPTPQQAFPQVSQAMPQQAASQVPSVPQQAFPQMPQAFSPYGQATQSNDTCSNTQNIPSEVVEIKQPYSAIEIISLVFGIISACTLGFLIFPNILGIIFSLIAWNQNGKKHEKMLTVSLLLSLLSLFVCVVLFDFL